MYSFAVIGMITLAFVFIVGAYYLIKNVGIKHDAKVNGDTVDQNKNLED